MDCPPVEDFWLVSVHGQNRILPVSTLEALRYAARTKREDCSSRFILSYEGSFLLKSFFDEFADIGKFVANAVIGVDHADDGSCQEY